MTEQIQPNPQALANPAFRDSALFEFERRAPELDPVIAEALKSFGTEAITPDRECGGRVQIAVARPADRPTSAQGD